MNGNKSHCVQSMLSFFLRTLLVSSSVAMLTFCQKASKIQEKPDEHRFKIIVLTEETMDPTAIAVTDNNRVFFAEDFGTIKVYNSSTNSVSMVGELPVYSCGEEGLIGMVLDPDFHTNGWLYVNRTVSDFWDVPCFEVRDDTTSYQVISRITVVDGILDMSSEKVLLKFPNQHMRHMGGSMAFDANENLYISVGENTHPGFLNPYAPLDERPGRSRFDTQRTSSNTLDFRGKILRIHPEDDGTYTIPDGNLFDSSDTLAHPEIYVMGCRNPFRISIDQRTGALYWGEVGPDAYADTDRGPKGYDEINRTVTGGFFGWPYFIADNQAYARYDYNTEKAGPFFEVNKPENASPNNTGKKILPPAQSAFIWYPYATSELFPELGEGGRTAMAGPVYHYIPGNKSEVKFPPYFDNALFIYDWMRGWIKIVKVSDKGELINIENFMPSTRFMGPIDMQFGPDGSLYVMEFGTTWGGNPDARLIKIEYVRGNRPPHVEISADQTVGICPLIVNLNSEGTLDYDKNDRLTYAWQFDSEEIQSSKENPTFVFKKPGVHTVRLTVTDAKGAEATVSIKIKAGNGEPKLSIDMPDRGSFYWDQDEISYVIHLEDKEDGSLEGGDIDPSNLQVHLEWMKGVYTMEKSATGSVKLKGRGQKLIGESDCKGCHKEREKAIGPSYLEVANKYKDDPKAGGYLAQKIISGGSGVWGDLNMSGHPIFSEEDARRMSDHILSLAVQNKNVKKIGVKGTIKIPANIESQGDRTYVIKATYTDQGSPGMEPITVSAMRTLVPPKLEAENFSSHRDLLSEVGNNMVSMGFSSTYISFKDIDLSNSDSVSFRYQYKGPECFITIKSDSPEGELIGKARFIGDPQSKGPRILSIPIKATSGSREIFFLHDKAPDIHEEISLDWIYFHQKN